jgi:serine/threonine-protein kinase
VDETDTARLASLAGAFPDTYVLERQAGRGGTARVYRAMDRRHGRAVAIKVMRSDLATPDVAARFLDEIKLTARLSHPHILPLLDSGSVEGTPFFVMPFVDGESLRERLRRAGRLPVGEALRIVGDVADALAYAHAQGIVHCDIKPDNILLSGRHALVGDFGVARAIRAATGDEMTTHLQLVIGTPAYMSPEQALGEGSIDGRSDVYSLGVVAFEMLAGAPPHEGTSVQDVMAKRLLEPIPSVLLWNSELPEALDGVLQTAMARERGDRYATAADFADVVAAMARRLSETPASIRAALPEPATRSIAVLPFRNLSPEVDNRYVSDGISEEVTAALGRLRTFRVCAYASASALAVTGLDPRTIGERLGVQHLLTGSVRRAGDRLRVSAELVNAVDGFQVWAEKYDRTFSDMMAVQDDIAEAIAASLATRAPAVGPALVSDTVTTHWLVPVRRDGIAGGANRARDSRANELYLRGRFLWNRRTRTSLLAAIRSFEAAIAIDAGFVLAHAGLAAARAMTALYGAAPPAAAMGEARRAAERALTLDARCAEAHTALALVLAGYEWKWAEAERELEVAARLAPSDATAHQWLATMCLLPKGRIDEALDAVRRALRLDPLSLAVKTTLAAVLYAARRYSEAVVAARDATSADPAFAPAHFFLGQTLTMVGDHEGAAEACRRACELSSWSAESLAVLCTALSRAGEASAARATYDELVAQMETGYVSKGQLALACLGVGDVEGACLNLEAAVEERATDLIWLPARPVWDPIRGEERVQRVLDRLGLAA